jgi:FAD/FMN-containing dehydrogenase
MRLAIAYSTTVACVPAVTRPSCIRTSRRHFYQPENQDDVEAIVADCAANKRRLRVVGSGLSPNGVGFSDEGMISMALLDKVLWVDPESQLVSIVGRACR